ncbi:hypothetical protein CD30_05930 [Ureibacillus massiliensis 4400831 = CIP 108448 = CCUG 49529]|uniref:Uncharacterized protein n=1 Tax=Ureibacillus massiliensis 4400831 = CIP 108448 = CCUG 49529 TaxID=1211035 RepID=A0A0A3J2X2_9BACL|nr:hypothetical protein [Ureibacillus massiliensis]KGR91354.1 hypothetical protein CD30_05930 [Ureibacillus massiliensis 4400831 = CIP 108448 = CCUG 49529]
MKNKENARFIRRENIEVSKSLTISMVKTKLYCMYDLMIIPGPYNRSLDVEILRDLLNGKLDEIISKEISDKKLSLNSYEYVFQQLSKRLNKQFNIFMKNDKDFKYEMKMFLPVLKLRLLEQFDTKLLYGAFTEETVLVMERIAKGDFDELFLDFLKEEKNNLTIDNCILSINSFISLINEDIKNAM